MSIHGLIAHFFLLNHLLFPYLMNSLDASKCLKFIHEAAVNICGQSFACVFHLIWLNSKNLSCCIVEGCVLRKC